MKQKQESYTEKLAKLVYAILITLFAAIAGLFAFAIIGYLLVNIIV